MKPRLQKYLMLVFIPDPMTGSEQKVLIFDASRCTACHYCELACSYSHFKVLDISKSNIHLIVEPDSGRREIIHCLHCDNALCLEACPTGAIYRDTKSKLVLVNPMKCIGCRSCITACPQGSVWFHDDEASARKCDFCEGEPKCAQFCSAGAIRVIDRSDHSTEFKKLGVL